MKNSLFRRTAAIVITIILLSTSVLSVGIFVSADSAYKVRLTKVYNRTVGDSVAGDNWNDYVVEQSGITTVAAGENYANNEAFICTKKGENTIIFRFDAGEKFLLRNPVIEWLGKAVTDANNYVRVYVGVTADNDGDWELVDAVGANTKLYSTDNNYTAPGTIDVSDYFGAGVRTMYIKVSMYLNNIGAKYRTSLSNLSVTANKVEGTQNETDGRKFLIKGIDDNLTLRVLDEQSFSIKALPLQMSDRTCSVSIKDSNIAELTYQNGSYTIVGVAEGKTDLTIRSNLDPSFNKVISVLVKGASYFFTDEYSIYSSDESGNINGGAASFVSNNTSGYAPVSMTAGDYIVQRNIDFSEFGKLGSCSIRAVFGWDVSKNTLAQWDIYVDSISDNNFVASVYAEPYGDSNGSLQTVYSGFSHSITGKHDMYLVMQTPGCRIYDVSYGNYVSNYSQSTEDYFDSTKGDSFLSHVVATRGLKYVDGKPLVAQDASTVGEIVYRVDASSDKTLSDVQVALSARNIDGSGTEYGAVNIDISYDRLAWYSLKSVTGKIENYIPSGLDSSITSIPSNEIKCKSYVMGQKTIYIKFQLKRVLKAQDMWNNIARIDLKITEATSHSAVAVATELAISSSPAIKWTSSKSGMITMITGDQVELFAEGLPVTAKDRTVKVVSSDSNVLQVESLGNGKYRLIPFEEGFAAVTISNSTNDIHKIVNITINSAPTAINMTLSVNPNKNENVQIVDDGKPHPINGSYTGWTGEEFGMGNTTANDYAHFKNVDFSEFEPNGPVFCYIKASNYSGENTDKPWTVYIDQIKDENKIAFFNVKPLNGWDYQQIVVSSVYQTLTGIHDVYLVCGEGGSVWSLTFTNDESVGSVSYELPFATTFDSKDTAWLDNIISSNGVSYNGELNASSYGKNYNNTNPVESYDDMEVNGTMLLRFDAPIGTILKNAILEYKGRSILSPTNDAGCKLAGKIQFYFSKDNAEWTKISELCDSEGTFAVNLASLSDELETFYIRIDVTRTSSFASWTRLNSLSVKADSGNVNVDLIKITPEPKGLTIPYTTDFTDNSWKDGVTAKSTGIAIQRSFDSMDMEVACLQPTSSKKYEGVVLKFIPEDGNKLENILLKLNGRAVGGSLLNANISTDNVNWTEAISVSDPAVTDDNYDRIRLFAGHLDTASDVVYVKLVFLSTGESFIDYSALTNLSISETETVMTYENVPFNTVFSIGRTQINSWLRKVTEMRGLFINQSSSTISMNPGAGKSGAITLQFCSGINDFNHLYLTLKGKAVNGSEIAIEVSTDGINFKTVAFINEQSDEYAASMAYTHEYDVSSEAKGHKNIWVRLMATSAAGSADAAITAFGISNTQLVKSSETMTDRWVNYVYDVSMFEDIPITTNPTDTAIGTVTDDSVSSDSTNGIPVTSNSIHITGAMILCASLLGVLAFGRKLIYKNRVENC